MTLAAFELGLTAMGLIGVSVVVVTALTQHADDGDIMMLTLLSAMFLISGIQGGVIATGVILGVLAIGFGVTIGSILDG